MREERESMQQTTGILLAGGKSRRYGTPKAFAEINNTFFYEYIYQLLHNTCDEVIIVTREEFNHCFKRAERVIVDIEKYKGCGPLAGMYSAMIESPADQYLVLPCDMPLLEQTTIELLLEKHQQDISIVQIENRLQPLVSVWNREMLPFIERALNEEIYSLKPLFQKHKVTYVPHTALTDDPATFLNVNTKEEDEEMREWLKS